MPTAFAFGLCLGAVPRAGNAAEPSPAIGGARGLLIGSVALMLGGVLAVVDYARVVVIFSPGSSAAPLAQRIVDGRKSIFFSHHADYAAATTSEHPADVIPAFLGAPHYLLDARLLQAWATALDQAGDTDHARYLAQRLREFRNDQSAEFFAPCEAAPEESDPVAAADTPAAALPFQCLKPSREFRFEDFR